MQTVKRSSLVGALGLGVALILGGGGCASDEAAAPKVTSPAVAPVSGYVSYDVADFSMKLQYPKDWEKEESKEEGGTIVQLIGPEENSNDPYRENITILKYDTASPSDAKLDNFVEFAQNDLKSASPDVVISDAGTISIGGAPGRKAGAKGTLKDGSAYQWMQYYVVANNKGYVFTFTDEPDTFSQNVATADKIISTVELR